jgi:hypothetical protein
MGHSDMKHCQLYYNYRKTVVIIHSTINKQDNRQQKGKLPTMNTDISHYYAHYNKQADNNNKKQQNNKITEPPAGKLHTHVKFSINI